MRLFVAGASGVIGRSLLPRLVAAGHDVTGMTRSGPRAEAIRAAGADAAVCDALDRDAVRDAVLAAAPDVIVQELTALPSRMKPHDRRQYAATNRVRRDGTAHLLAAARAAGVRRLVWQSMAFAYAPGSPPSVKPESAPLFLDAPGPFGEVVRTIADVERTVLEANGMDALVLRYGWLYGPGTYFGETGAIAEDVRRRRFPVIGKGGGVMCFLHVDDAASATAAAVERGAPGIYNVVDDEPAPGREWLPVYAAADGAKQPLHVPAWLARLAGGPMVSVLTGQPGAANAAAKRELGWQPRWPSWRQGFREAPR